MATVLTKICYYILFGGAKCNFILFAVEMLIFYSMVGPSSVIWTEGNECQMHNCGMFLRSSFIN